MSAAASRARAHLLSLQQLLQPDRALCVVLAVFQDRGERSWDHHRINFVRLAGAVTPKFVHTNL